MENTLTAPNLTEQNKYPVVMATPHPRTVYVNDPPWLIFIYHNVQPKLKAQKGLVRNSVVFCISLYIYHYEVSRNELIEELRIVQVPNVQKNIIQCRIKYFTRKSFGCWIYFCDRCTEFPQVTPVKNNIK